GGAMSFGRIVLQGNPTVASGMLNIRATPGQYAIILQNRNATRTWGIQIDAVSVDDLKLAFNDVTGGVAPFILSPTTGGAEFLGVVRSGGYRGPTTDYTYSLQDTGGPLVGSFACYKVILGSGTDTSPTIFAG